MMEEKVYPKGTKIKLNCACRIVGSQETDEIILDEDMTESQVDELAREFMEERIGPEWGFEEVE